MNEKQTFFDSLMQIRSNLQDAVRSADHLQFKLIGSGGNAEKTPSPMPSTVDTILGEIQNLSQQLSKQMGLHHDILGESPTAIQGGTASRPPARA